MSHDPEEGVRVCAPAATLFGLSALLLFDFYGFPDGPVPPLTVWGCHLQGQIFRIFLMTFSGPYEGIQCPYGRILDGGDKISD